MEAIWFAALFLAWNACGFYAGVKLVHATGKDFTSDDILLALWMGLGGPIMLIICAFVAWIGMNEDRVIFKRKAK